MRNAWWTVFALAAAAQFAGCSGPQSKDAQDDARLHLDDFTTAVGTIPVRRVDALFAPGGHSATAWLGDGTLWNGDVELALLDLAGRPVPLDDGLAFQGRELGLHRDAPAAIRASTSGGGGLRYTVRAFAPWTGGDADSASWTRVALEVTLPTVTSERSSFAVARIGLRAAGESEHPLHPEATPADSFRYEVREGRLLRDGRLVALVRATVVASSTERPGLKGRAEPLERGPIIAPALRRVPLISLETDRVPASTLPGPVLTFDVWLAPVGGVSADLEPPDAALSFDASFARTVAAWRAEMAQGATMEHPDPRLQAALVNAHRLLVGNRERRSGATHFLGSPFQYRDLYLRDGARVVHALALLGRADLAGQALTSLYEFQWPGGAFLSQRGQLDGTGQALWALGSYAALGGDPALVDRLVGPALRGARWIALQRASATLRGGPAAGLLPYADPRDNELARGHLFGNDAWAIAGLEALAPLVRARGRAATADTLAAEIRAYRVRLLDAWDAAARRQGRALPPVLEGGGRDWGNLSAAYPCGVLAADDARVVALDRFLRAYHTRDGLLTYGPSDSVHHYLGFDRTQAALRRGDRAAFRADLEAILDHAQPDGSGFEFASRDGRYGENLPPHGTFAAMFVDLVRSSIVYERGDSLVLFAGAPANLAADASAGLVVRALPTRFGALDLAARIAPDGVGAVIEATLPVPATVAWPPPARVRAVIDSNGTPRPVTDGRFTLPAGRATWRLEFEPAGGGEEGR